MNMKAYKIIYYIKPDAQENLEIIIKAKNYQDACIVKGD